MYIQQTGRWVDALRHSLQRVHEPTTRLPIPWLLSGEAALALHGVDIEPDIIEFRAISPYAVAYFSGFMRPYEVPANSTTVVYRRGGDLPPSDGWRSNLHQRIVAWNDENYACWLGRWNVDGFTVQAFYARDLPCDPLADIDREDIRRIHFDGMEIAVAPLEFLLADSAARDQGHRQGQNSTNRILHALRCAGYDRGTLSRAMDALPSDRAMRLLRLLEIRLVAG